MEPLSTNRCQILGAIEVEDEFEFEFKIGAIMRLAATNLSQL
jgi:hypothetical protein